MSVEKLRIVLLSSLTICALLLLGNANNLSAAGHCNEECKCRAICEVNGNEVFGPWVLVPRNDAGKCTANEATTTLFEQYCIDIPGTYKKAECADNLPIRKVPPTKGVVIAN